MRKKIGIIGGLSPESTAYYYLHITRSYVKQFGDYNYPEIIIYSVNLENYHRWRRLDRWDRIINDLTAALRRLVHSGADFAIIATNTMHKVYNEVIEKIDIPIISIIDETACKAFAMGINTLGILGTKYTMADGFYQEQLAKFHINSLVPSSADQHRIHKIIVEELVRGCFLPESKRIYIEIIQRLQEQGAEGIVLGCTEIPLLIRQQDCAIQLLDTAKIHAEAALREAITESGQGAFREYLLS